MCFSIDNYSKGIKLKDMQDRHSNVQLEGIMEMAHQVKPFTNTTWDGLHITLEYVPYQNIPSPVCMVDYPAYAELSPATFFTTHKAIPPSTSRCINGPRCAEYDHRLTRSKWMNILPHAFQSIDVSYTTTPCHSLRHLPTSTCRFKCGTVI